eukprot:3917857-Pyramimonas_sp.AAC.1
MLSVAAEQANPPPNGAPSWRATPLRRLARGRAQLNCALLQRRECQLRLGAKATRNAAKELLAEALPTHASLAPIFGAENLPKSDGPSSHGKSVQLRSQPPYFQQPHQNLILSSRVKGRQHGYSDYAPFGRRPPGVGRGR